MVSAWSVRVTLSNYRILNRIALIGATVLALPGCTSSPTESDPGSADLEEVTFHLPGMNKRLKIL